MGNEWYSDLPNDTDALYEESVRRIKSAVEKAMSFEQAVKLIDVKDASLKAAIIDDALKVIIAEMHFVRKKSVDEVAKALKLPAERITKARQEMLADVEQAAIDAYKSQSGQQQGNA